jgi:molecular chaperone DnaK (HSP70)
LSNLKDKIKKSCLASPTSMAKLRRSLNIAKNSFNKDGISQIEVSINKLNDATDLKITINKKDYIKSCIGLFRKIIYLIKDVILKSNIDIKDINDIILIGDITQNIKLKNMISEIFKDNNKKIYNKLTNKINENGKNIDNYTIKGAIIQCFNDNMINPKYKLINITQSSFGIESINGIMDIVIEKGSNIPIKFNKFIKVQIPEKSENNNYININIYEGENKFVKNNRLISSRYYSLKNFKNEKKDEKSIEILFQFFIDSKNNLNVCVLDKDNFRKKIECLNNRNYI